MKRIIFLSAILFLCSCATKSQKTEIENFPLPFQSYERPDTFRKIASDDVYFENSFKMYFGKSTFFERLQKIRRLTYKLNEEIPDKGYSRKNLLLKFIDDFDIVYKQIESDSQAQSDSIKSWIPSSQIKNFNRKINFLGKIVQSAKVMDRLGIFLTASQVMEEDSKAQNFYYSMISRAIGEINNEISGLTLVYKIEDQETDLREAQIAYSKYLATKVRAKLYKLYDEKNKSKRLSIESVLKKVEMVSSASEAKKLIKNSNWIYMRSELSKAEAINSSEIEGFREEEDVKVTTYFAVQMIENLYQSLR